MSYVYVIERTASFDIEGISRLSVEVYRTLDKARQRLREMFNEDLTEVVDDEIDIKRSGTIYEVSDGCDVFKGEIKRQKVN